MKIPDRCHIEMNHIILIHMLLEIVLCGNLCIFKKLIRITAATIVSINHSGSMRFAKTSGMTDSNAITICTYYIIQIIQQSGFVNINLAILITSKTFVIRIKISSHVSSTPFKPSNHFQLQI